MVEVGPVGRGPEQRSVLGDRLRPPGERNVMSVNVDGAMSVFLDRRNEGVLK